MVDHKHPCEVGAAHALAWVVESKKFVSQRILPDFNVIQKGAVDNIRKHCSLMQRRINLEQLVTFTCRCRQHVILCCAVIFN
jgi:hypothetical protein